jgi:hypothetical protein
MVGAALATMLMATLAGLVFWEDAGLHRDVQAAVERGEVRVAEGLATQVWHRRRAQQFVVADLPFDLSVNTSVGFSGGGGLIREDRPVRLHYVALPLPTILRIDVPQGDPRCEFAP